MNTNKNSKDGHLKIILQRNINDEDLKNLLAHIKNKGNIKSLKLDLRNVMYMYSKNLADLISLKKYCTEKKIDLILANVSDGVLQLLEIADLMSLFKIEEDYSSYSPDELISLFLDPERADFMTDYLSHHYTDEVKDRIHSAINSDDPILKEYAIITAGKAQDHSALKGIRNALKDDVVPVVRAAVLVVGWLNDMESKDFLYELLESEYVDIVEAAAISISLMSSEKDAFIIGKLLESSDERKRRIAVNALGLINDDASYNLLINRYKIEENLYIKALIIRTLSFFKKDDLVDFFVNELENNSIEVQEAATSALVRLKATNKVENLVKKLDAEKSWESFFSVKALGELACSREIINQLKIFYNQAQLHVKIAIVEAIGKISTKLSDSDKSDILSFMKEALKEKNDDIRKSALDALKNITKEECISEAIKLLSSDESWIVRLKSIEILCELKPHGYKKILEEHLRNEKNRYVIEKIQDSL